MKLDDAMKLEFYNEISEIWRSKICLKVEVPTRVRELFEIARAEIKTESADLE